jgi:hypothetical protein
LGDFHKNLKNQENLEKNLQSHGEKRIADIDIPN